MSAPLIWIVFPALAGLVFWLIRRRGGLVIVLSTLLCLVLALLASVLPIGQLVRLGPLSFTIDPALDFVGRRLLLSAGDRAYLIFVYLLCAFWFAGASAARASRLLIPFGLGMVALLIAAQAVEPFLYAALLVEMAVLLAVPILVPPGEKFSQGVLRFLIFQTLAMPFILLAGWAMAGVEANPTNVTLVTFSIAFLGLGFAFWLAVFPFYTWIPLLAEQTFPYVSGFVFLLLITNNLLLGLSFIDSFGWLRASPNLFSAISLVGTVMIVTAGVWSAFQKDLSRLLGYAVIVETGFSLLAVGLANRSGQELFAGMFLPRLVGLALWALSLSILTREARSARFEDLQGVGQRMPFATAGLAVASLTLGGLPLLAIFPIRQALLEELARQTLPGALWVLAGSFGVLVSILRALSILLRGRAAPVEETDETDLPLTEARARLTISETRWQIALLLGGIAILLLIGIFPQVFLPILNGLLSGYTQLP